jgi:hypothetical protein
MRLSPSRAGAAAAVAAAVVLGLTLSTLGPGCGPAEPQFDKTALYTPESLAQELAFRYSALNPTAKKSTRKMSSGAKSAKRIADLEGARTAEKKGGNTAATKKQTGPPTIDDVLEDVESKIDTIRGTSRAETCRQMIETISKDSSLTESDKQLLTEKLRELAGAS